MRFGSLLLGISFLISKLVGLFRDTLLASYFGAGNEHAAVFNLDVYYAAFRIPDFLFNLLSFGVLSAIFVPLFIEIKEKEGKAEANLFTNQILHLGGALIALLSVVLFILAPVLVKVIVPGFSPEMHLLTIQITRIMLCTPILFTISGILSGLHNANHRYWGIALAPIAYNIGIIIATILFGKTHGVFGVSFGVVIGATLHLAMQIPGLLRDGFRYRFLRAGQLISSKVKELARISLPRVFGMSVTQLSLLIDTIIASSLLPGTITIMNFSSNIEHLPIGMGGVAISVVSFSVLSTHFVKEQTAEFTKEIQRNLHKILFIVLPLALGGILFRFEIVRVLLGRGAFDEKDILLTANTVGILMVGVSFGSLIFLFARAFYAQKNTKIPVLAGIMAVITNATLGLVLTRYYHLGTYGLALAHCGAALVNAGVLFVALRKKLSHHLIDYTELGKSITALVVAGTAAFFVHRYTPQLAGTLQNNIVHLAIGGGVLLAVYGGVCFLLQKE